MAWPSGPTEGWMTSQGSAHGRFTRALAQRNLRGAETAAKEMGGLSLIDALDYLVMLAEVRPEKAQAAAIRWHGRLELESVTLSLVESQLALAALADLCAGSKEFGACVEAATASSQADDAPERFLG
jgi:hypothetical protein